MDRRRFIQTISAIALSGSLPSLGQANSTPTQPLSPFTLPSQEPKALEDADTYAPKVGIVAIGGAGISILRDTKDRLPNLSRTVAISDNPFILHRSGVDVPLLMEKSASHTLGIQQVQKNYSAISRQLVAAVQDLDLVFILSGLGGVVGTAIAPKVAQTLAQLNIFNLAVAVTPFEFEGLRRNQIAMTGLNALRRRTATTFQMSNQRFASTMDESATLASVLDRAPQGFEEIYRTTLKPITNFSFVGVDFEDIRMTLSHHGAGGISSAIGGIDNVATTTEYALTDLSSQLGNLNGASGIVAVVEGAQGKFPMRLLREAINTVHQHIGEETFIIFSAHYDDTLVNQIRVSLLGGK